MFTIQDYIDSLNRDKESLVENLTTKGVSASDSETFTTLVPKVLDITSVNNQSKSATITSNTTTTITPDEGYTGLSSVEVTTNVAMDLSDYISPTISAGTSGGSGDSGYLKMLIKIPNSTTVNGTSLKWAFSSVPTLTEIPLIDTSNVTTMEQMCYASTNITTIPILNTSSVTNMNYMFSYIEGLTDSSLDNILQMCINATSYNGTKTLKQIGISSRYATRIQALPHYQDFLDAGWTLGY